MRAVSAGDTQALRQLLELYWQPLVDYAFSFAGHVDTAEDIVQEAFVRVWQRRIGVAAEGSVRGMPLSRGAERGIERGSAPPGWYSSFAGGSATRSS